MSLKEGIEKMMNRVHGRYYERTFEKGSRETLLKHKGGNVKKIKKEKKKK